MENMQPGSRLYSPHSDMAEVELLPNPEFTFPARRLAEPQTSGFGAERPVSASFATSGRSRMSGLSSRRTASTLPNFTFNPSASSSTSDTTSTPPRSPTLAIPNSPSRPFGHRRGGSEFIGGDGQGKRGSVLSTSPTKGDNILPPPVNASRLGPPGGRRSHAHRRSGAISCHDLQSILQPKDANMNLRGSSAPTSPLEAEVFTANISGQGAAAAPLLDQENVDKQNYGFPGNDTGDSPPRSTSRTRVGFSETIEYIRPLSTISSGTESSMSTIRGHSVNGSFSSVLSNGSSPPSHRPNRPSLQTTFEDEDLLKVRPNTASGALEATASLRDELIDSSELRPRPSTASTSESFLATSPANGSPVKTKITKRRHLGWFNDRTSPKSMEVNLETHSEPSLLVTTQDTAAFLDSPADDSDTLIERSRESKFDGDRKPRKVKSWAHTLLPSRSKPKLTYVDNLPVAVGEAPGSSSETRYEESFLSTAPDFDSDNTVDIISAVEQSRPSPLTSSSSAQTPRSAASFELDITSPIIDLDAALGPFKTPPLGPQTVTGCGVSRRRVMHSGAFGNGLNVLGEHHRRTESAPELAPFESRTSPMNVMADVFEEEEEEDGESLVSGRRGTDLGLKPHTPTSKPDSVLSSPTPGPTISAEALDMDQAVSMGLGISADRNIYVHIPDGNGHSHLRGATSPARDDELRAGVESSPIEVVEDHEEPRAASFGRESDSTITPTMSEDGDKPSTLLVGNIAHAPPSLTTADSIASSPLSTPDYHHLGRGSYDTPRIGTSASSIAESRNGNSYMLGEPGPEFRPSVDDVPSLTSSRSTMTSPGQHPLSRGYSVGDTRSASVSSIPSAGAERTRKRNSIASLSRLISGSYSEKSKLSIESRPQSAHRSVSQGEEIVRNKKKKRISRLMSFWKSKETLT